MARPREFDERTVLDAARDEFWRTGYAGTSVDAITTATGLGKGSLYGAFGGKRELFLRVLDDYCTGATTAAARQLRGDDASAYERLTAYLIGHAVVPEAVSRRGCLLAKSAAELAEQDEAVRDRARHTLEEIRATLEAEIQACQRHGDIDPDADPRHLANLLLTVQRGLEALGKAGLPESDLRSAAEAALAQLPRPTR